MDISLIKTDATNIEIIKENSSDESDVDVKVDILRVELLPIDHQQIEIKDEYDFRNEAENLISQDQSCFNYDNSCMPNSTSITEMQIHRDEIPYNCLENKCYSKGAADLLDHERIRESDKSYKCVLFNSNMSSKRTTMTFDEETNLKYMCEISKDDSDVDIKIDIIHNELLPNNNQQSGVKDKFKTEIESSPEQKCSTDGKLEKCLQCSFSCINTASLKRHKCIYSNEKLYKCVEVNSSVRKKNHLNKNKVIHTGKTLYKCLECDSTFKHKSHLTSHKLIHTGTKPYKCLECDSSFRRKSHLNRHKLIHVEKKPYKCIECESTFADKSDLNKHKLIHTGVKPYKCLSCDSCFRQKGTLNRHMLIHTGEKPYKCVQCESTFRYKCDLNKHKFIHTGEKPYTCLQCDSCFRQIGTLNRHMLIHNTEKPYKCLE